jgi:hypothetical protein
MLFWLSLPMAGKQLLSIDREAVEMNYILLEFIDSTKTFDGCLGQPLLQRVPGVRYVHHRSIMVGMFLCL